MTLAVLVVAKAPVSGQAKTRLASQVGVTAAAELAAAALLDTLDVVESVTGPDDRLLCLAGDLADACRGGEVRSRLARWQVRPQRGEGLAQRLVAAHHDAADLWDGRRVVAQIGMDTPCLTADDLRVLAAAASEPVRIGLGPAADGGWWGLARRSAGYVAGLVDVPMSAPDTCQHTRAALEAGGATVTDVHTLTDVDDLAGAETVSRQAPDTRFARCFAGLFGDRTVS